jgi:hypothetical protein
MFQTPSPQFINFTHRSTLLAQTLEGSDHEAFRKLREDAQLPLPSMKQPVGGQIGFFEQGLLTGVSVLATSTVASVALLSFYGVPAIMRRLR